jgi:hypothetical protein
MRPRIDRRPNAHGTNLEDKSQPIIYVFFPGGGYVLLGQWSLMNGKPATECTDDEILAALREDESI